LPQRCGALLGACGRRRAGHTRARRQGFHRAVAKQDSFNKRRLRKLLQARQSQPAIIEAMDKPAEKAKPWYDYRPIFVNDKRIQRRREFWLAHRAGARPGERATACPGVLVAILGVETYYGRKTGHYRVLDALATLAFDYPAARQVLPRTSSNNFFLLTRETAIDPLTAKGSYAGAMGAPQFMPSNYRRYAVDADHDGRIDLWTNWPDVFASVGNYFKEHGWNAGEPVLSEAALESDAAPDLGRPQA
jgi:membrane-bound lytic murein transglycosylase B